MGIFSTEISKDKIIRDGEGGRNRNSTTTGENVKRISILVRVVTREYSHLATLTEITARKFHYTGDGGAYWLRSGSRARLPLNFVT